MTQPAYTSHTPACQASMPNIRKGESAQSSHSKQKSSGNSVDELMSKNRKFELLSAYIDNEVSEEERQEVEGWLNSDPQMRQQYKAQLKLSRAMKSLLG